MQNLVSASCGDFHVGNSDENDLVGHGASASAELCSSVGAFSENECFHLGIHPSLTARP